MKDQTAPIPTAGAQRRSTRVPATVPLVITSQGPRAKILTEETSSFSINCHGCRYLSKHRTQIGAQVIIQVVAPTEGGLLCPQPHPARVVWRRKSKRLDSLYQIGAEFETPLNLWSIENPPEDWEPFSIQANSQTDAGVKVGATSDRGEDPTVVLTDVERLLEFAREGTHYQLLDIHPDVDRAVVKQKFYHLAQRFHPDRNMDHPEWTPRLSDLMNALNTAYKILSDEEARKQYDFSLAQIHDRDVSESKQVARECLEKAQECLAERNYVGSILWLRRAIDNEPDTSGYRTMLAQSLASIPEYRREAVEQFEKAIELDPDNITARLQYGELLEQMRLPWRARHHYVHVLELVMDHREARDRLNRLDSATPRATSRPSLLGRLRGRR